jgi:hypothetical protein
VKSVRSWSSLEIASNTPADKTECPPLQGKIISLIIFSLIMFYIWGQTMVELVFDVSVEELCHCFPAEGKHATIIINRTFFSLWNWGTIRTINYILNNISWNFTQKVVHHFEMCMKDNIYGQASCRDITLGRLRHFTMISYVGDLVSATHPIWFVGFLWSFFQR